MTQTVNPEIAEIATPQITPTAVVSSPTVSKKVKVAKNRNGDVKYIPGHSCYDQGFPGHLYKKVPKTNYERCTRCGSGRTISKTTTPRKRKTQVATTPVATSASSKPTISQIFEEINVDRDAKATAQAVGLNEGVLKAVGRVVPAAINRSPVSQQEAENDLQQMGGEQIERIISGQLDIQCQGCKTWNHPNAVVCKTCGVELK